MSAIPPEADYVALLLVAGGVLGVLGSALFAHICSEIGGLSTRFHQSLTGEDAEPPSTVEQRARRYSE